MTELVTADTILGWLHEQVQNKRPIAPEFFLECATKLNILKSDEDDKLIDLEHVISRAESEMIAEGATAAAAKAHVKGMDAYKLLRKQQAKMKRIDEAIRLAKLSARIKNDELGRGL